VLRSLIAIGVFCLSASVYAGGIGQACEVEDITTPCVDTSWGLEAHALYLQVGSGFNDSVIKIQTNNGSLNDGSTPKWGWGFQVGGTLVWGNGSDFVWNWYDFRNTYRPSALPSSVYLGKLLINPNQANENLGSLNQVRVDQFDSNKTLEWDQINLEFGQNININDNIHIRPHADLQIARLASYLVDNTSGYNQAKGDYSYGEMWSTVYDGVGPRVGAYFDYLHDSGLGFYAQGAIGLLAGPSKSNLQIIDQLYQVTNFFYNSSILVVPNFDTKLGSRLQFEISQGVLSFDLGWMWDVYSNPLTSVVSDDEKKQNNYSVQGLYFGLKWLGTIA
jgi:hypothetical protein